MDWTNQIAVCGHITSTICKTAGQQTTDSGDCLEVGAVLMASAKRMGFGNVYDEQ